MTTPSPLALPGPVRQVGYVVRDLEQAIATWCAMGVGPWYLVRGTRQRARYRGQPCVTTLSVAFANSGELQIELIHQDDDTPSIYTEFLDAGHEGFHQLAWWTDDFDGLLRAADEAGWPELWAGGDDDGPRYVYFEPPAGPATVAELMEITPITTGMAQLVRDAAIDWDGSEPIRNLI
jgi:catechol 2,3-dioxygenase-like lactoylglutathione lyase family enzyme